MLIKQKLLINSNGKIILIDKKLFCQMESIHIFCGNATQ